MISKYVYIHTIGCQMNVYDSEWIAKGLKTLRYELTSSLETADLIIVNTCSIREKAEQKVFSFLGRLDRLKGLKPELIIGVGGCVAQQEGAKLLERVPNVDLVFGTNAIGRLPGLVEKITQKKCRIVDVEMSEKIEEFNIL
jgi:tRNA-2-methylthio-N6-dimethylallyladenosine synthase